MITTDVELPLQQVLISARYQVVNACFQNFQFCSQSCVPTHLFTFFPYIQEIEGPGTVEEDRFWLETQNLAHSSLNLTLILKLQMPSSTKMTLKRSCRMSLTSKVIWVLFTQTSEHGTKIRMSSETLSRWPALLLYCCSLVWSWPLMNLIQV